MTRLMTINVNLRLIARKGGEQMKRQSNMVIVGKKENVCRRDEKHVG
jgi:hypothetical protein